MRLAFITAQSPTASSNIGRILPLAEQLSGKFEVHVLVHSGLSQITPGQVKIHTTGRDPFTRTPQGKKRLRGLALIFRLMSNALRAALKLVQLKPQVVIISKSLPESVFAAGLYSLFKPRTEIILDVDDFELTANKLSSLWQRAAVHWAERTGARLASIIVTATPFLSDHFEQLTKNKKKVIMIPTGIAKNAAGQGSNAQSIRRPSGHGVPPLGGTSEAEAKRARLAGPRDATRSIETRPAKPQVLYLGSVSISSGHRVDLLPEILEQVNQEIPDIKLTIAGDGDDVENLKEKIAALKLAGQVTWHGRFTLSEVAELVWKTNVIIDPIDDSITNRAKSSFRTLAAAIHGHPVVTSNIGIRPYLLPDELHNIFFAKTADVADYAQKIVSLIRSPLTAEQQTSLTARAAKFTWPQLAQVYSKLLV